MIILLTIAVAILMPVIIWTVIANMFIFKNGWNWKKVCEAKVPYLKFLYIWGKFWLYTAMFAGWLWFSYMIACLILKLGGVA